MYSWNVAAGYFKFKVTRGEECPIENIYLLLDGIMIKVQIVEGK